MQHCTFNQKTLGKSNPIFFLLHRPMHAGQENHSLGLCELRCILKSFKLLESYINSEAHLSLLVHFHARANVCKKVFQWWDTWDIYAHRDKNSLPPWYTLPWARDEKRRWYTVQCNTAVPAYLTDQRQNGRLRAAEFRPRRKTGNLEKKTGRILKDWGVNDK